MATPSRDNTSQTEPARFSHPAAGGVVVLVAGLSAAWFAAGSTGLLGHPLQHAMTWLCLALATIAAWPPRRSLAAWAVLTGGAVLAVAFTSSNLPAVNVLAVAVMLAAIAQSSRGLTFVVPASAGSTPRSATISPPAEAGPTNRGMTGRLALIAALAATVLGCFRLACSSIPAVWLAADAAGRALGRVAGWITGNRETIGATFGGIDFLVAMAAVYVAWVVCTAPPRRRHALWAAAAIVIGQFIYLIALGCSQQLLDLLPDLATPPPIDLESYVGIWTWGNGLRTLIPWNVPLLALLIHGSILAVMVRGAAWLPAVELSRSDIESQKERDRREDVPGSVLVRDMLFGFGPALLAVAAALLTALAVNPSDLRGKTVVAYQTSAADFAPPQYDSDAGQYAMLAPLVESLGGKFKLSKDLSGQDLAEADVLLLVDAGQPLPPGTLGRVWDYVRGGGSLLLVGQASLPVQDVLDPLAVRFRPGAAVGRTDGWEHSYDVLAHAATAGLDDLRNRFGVQSGVALRVRWPARPVLVGRWGWSEPPNDAAVAAASQLGDLVLAAEQGCGAGRAVVLGDASALHNETLAGDYPFVGRLLGYLAHRPASPQDLWRQLLALAALAAMLALLCFRSAEKADSPHLHERGTVPFFQPAAWQVMLTGAVLAATLVCVTTAAYWSGRVLPDGRSHSAGGFNNVAYIDASHLESYGGQPGDRQNARGIAGLLRTLMRQGYLPLLASDLTKERLSRAGLLISIGPARQFSTAEREAIKDFVGGGGTLVCLVGAEEARPSAPLLADFGLKVPPSPVPPGEKAREPEPLGAFQQTFTQATGDRYVQFYAGWPVEETKPPKPRAQPTDESPDESRNEAMEEPTGDPGNKATPWVAWFEREE